MNRVPYGAGLRNRHFYSLVGFLKSSNTSQLRSNAELLFYLVHPERRRHSMTTELAQLAAKANSDAKQGLNPSSEYLKVVNGKKKRAAKTVAQARVLGLIERALYGRAS